MGLKFDEGVKRIAQRNTFKKERKWKKREKKKTEKNKMKMRIRRETN